MEINQHISLTDLDLQIKSSFKNAILATSALSSQVAAVVASPIINEIGLLPMAFGIATTGGVAAYNFGKIIKTYVDREKLDDHIDRMFSFDENSAPKDLTP